MRHTVRAFVFVLSVVLLSSSLPASAAEQSRDRVVRERATPVVIVKRIIKRFFGIMSNEEMTPPHPAPTTTTP